MFVRIIILIISPMDPLTQGLLGGIVAQSLAKRENVRIAAGIGALSGMAADLDILIRSDSDPLMFIEYHRHFTHSLFFAPIGGFVVALFLWIFLRKIIGLKEIIYFSIIGYATHGILDSATSYGTHLFWPISNARLSFDVISIIDPAVTLTLLVFVILGLWRLSIKLPRIGLAMTLLYFAFASFQHISAKDMAIAKAAERGHKIAAIRVMPTMGNVFLWRSVYESQGKYFADAVYVNPLGTGFIYEGESINKIDLQEIFPNLDDDSIQRAEIRRFAFFSDGFVGIHPDHPDVIGDLRYSSMPNKLVPLWGIKVDEKNPDSHVKFENFRRFREGRWEEFWLMINGKKKE